MAQEIRNLDYYKDYMKMNKIKMFLGEIRCNNCANEWIFLPQNQAQSHTLRNFPKLPRFHHLWIGAEEYRNLSLKCCQGCLFCVEEINLWSVSYSYESGLSWMCENNSYALSSFPFLPYVLSPMFDGTNSSYANRLIFFSFWSSLPIILLVIIIFRILQHDLNNKRTIHMTLR